MRLRVGRRRPLVSLVVCTKNAMPYIVDAVESLRRLTYRPFEVVVQDCVSTDGTAEFLGGLNGFERFSFVSEPDNGIGDAFNRAVARCAGEVVGSLDGDNLLEPRALDVAVEELAAHPEAAAVYGSVAMIDAEGRAVGTFDPAPFDLAGVMRCEIVPPFSTTFLARENCGPELRFDESLRTCADYDLWLRLSDRRILRSAKTQGRTRLSPNSMSQQANQFEQFCVDKLTALDNLVRRRPELAAERAASAAGIYCWAAESVCALEGRSTRFARLLERAVELAPESLRVRQLREADLRVATNERDSASSDL